MMLHKFLLTLLNKIVNFQEMEKINKCTKSFINE